MANSFNQLAQLKKQLAERAAQEQRRVAAALLERKQQAALEHARAREQALFRDTVGKVKRLPNDGRADLVSKGAPPIAKQREADELAALAESLSDEIDISSLLDTDDQLSYCRDGISSDVARRLRRGEWAIKAQIDLHGLRVDEARPALVEFLSAAAVSEHRCVRIIHGKGLGSVNREPVLKGKVLKWLVQRQDVLAFCQARPNDGGAGALIVLMNRSPK